MDAMMLSLRTEFNALEEAIEDAIEGFEIRRKLCANDTSEIEIMLNESVYPYVVAGLSNPSRIVNLSLHGRIPHVNALTASMNGLPCLEKVVFMDSCLEMKDFHTLSSVFNQIISMKQLQFMGCASRVLWDSLAQLLGVDSKLERLELSGSSLEGNEDGFMESLHKSRSLRCLSLRESLLGD